MSGSRIIMKFTVSEEVFEKIPNLYIGVVAARFLNNGKEYPEIGQMLDEAIDMASARFLNAKVKEEPDIIPYRDAFRELGINPNKFMCSIEALFTRIAKGKGMGHINPLVDLNNAISLKYTLPMGTHDLALSEEDICLRYSRPGDTFLPFGAEAEETPDAGEVVYAVGSQVRTRRWAWRQSEHGKIDENTSYVFFPIDGFKGINDDRVDAAAEELQKVLETVFGCKTVKGAVSAENREMDLAIEA